MDCVAADRVADDRDDQAGLRDFVGVVGLLRAVVSACSFADNRLRSKRVPGRSESR